MFFCLAPDCFFFFFNKCRLIVGTTVVLYGIDCPTHLFDVGSTVRLCHCRFFSYFCVFCFSPLFFRLKRRALILFFIFLCYFLSTHESYNIHVSKRTHLPLLFLAPPYLLHLARASSFYAIIDNFRRPSQNGRTQLLETPRLQSRIARNPY